MTRKAKIWLIAIAGVLAFGLMVWLVGWVLGLHGGAGWIFRGVLWLLGLLAGAVQGPVFGPLVAFGPGGVLAELIGQAQFRLAPLTDLDAEELGADIYEMCVNSVPTWTVVSNVPWPMGAGR